MKTWGAIFDLDGVTVDTVQHHFSAWKRMFEEHGKSFTFDDYKQKVDGIPRIAGCKAILTEAGEEELQKACEIKQGYFLERLKTEGVRVYDSTVQLVRDMRTAGIKVALISSSKNLTYIIESGGIQDIWDVIITGNDIPRGKGKPDPFVFLSAAGKLGMEPASCIVFEDAVQGVEAAKRGGMKCVGIGRHGDPKRLAGADIVVKDLAEVDLEKLEELVAG